MSNDLITALFTKTRNVSNPMDKALVDLLKCFSEEKPKETTKVNAATDADVCLQASCISYPSKEELCNDGCKGYMEGYVPETKEVKEIIDRLETSLDSQIETGTDTKGAYIPYPNFTQPLSVIPAEKAKDPVNPDHYKKGAIECINVTEHLPFLDGNAIKYIWRHKYKNGAEDIKKAIWYCKRILKKDYGIDEYNS